MSRPYEHFAASLATSEAIIEAIAEVVGDDEEAMHAEWDDPQQMDAHDYIMRASAISPGIPLYWGAEGCVYEPEEEGA